jgi:hypothetical protein
MRLEVRNEMSPVVARAVGMARPGAPIANGDARSFSAPADLVTAEGVDGGGTIYTIFPALTDVDSTDDLTAVTSS